MSLAQGGQEQTALGSASDARTFALQRPRVQGRPFRLMRCVWLVAVLIAGAACSNSPAIGTQSFDAPTVHGVTHDTAVIAWRTRTPARVQVAFGLSEADLDRRTPVADGNAAEHRVMLAGLEPETRIFFQTSATDASGDTVVSDVEHFRTAPLRRASEVTQHGITWTFDRAYPVGQFVNGDWWVVGPVTITDIDPRPGPAAEGASIAGAIRANRWGDTSLRDDGSWRHGSMVVMRPGTAQGYDSRNQNFRADAAVELPLTLPAERSLVSSISHGADLPNQVMHHAMMWSGERTSARVMKTAAVLTSLADVPPGDAFRPTFIGADKRIYRARDLRWDRLLTLDPASIPVPDWAMFERWFERPWIDHLNGSWLGQMLLPTENMPAYGRENARIVGAASLMLQLDVPQAQKHDLLVGLIQVGIDLRGIAMAGGRWNEGGGHTSGRKWPIVFAGMMLDAPDFAELPASAVFQEDTQTYPGEGWAGQQALWQMVNHHGCRQPYMHLPPEAWPEHDPSGAFGGRSGASVSESYRLCCGPVSWPGQALAALLMGARSTWDHEPFFETVDDWMRETDRYAAGRGGHARPTQEGRLLGQSPDRFVAAMWRAYRDSVPDQPAGTTVRKWRACEGRWVTPGS